MEVSRIQVPTYKVTQVKITSKKEVSERKEKKKDQNNGERRTPENFNGFCIGLEKH
jgi:phage head maturation protease